MDDLMEYVHQPVTYVVELDRDDIAELVDAAETLARQPGNTVTRVKRLLEVAERLAKQAEYVS